MRTAAALLALSLAAGCSPAPEAGPRLVLLYATCTVNRHDLAPYDDGVVFTPALASFAREARVFRRHQTEAGQSGPAFASLFTGVQADRHGVYRHPTPLAADVEPIGEVFGRAGWETHAWLDHGMASEELGYGRGATVRGRLLTAEDPDFAALLDGLARDPRRRALVYTSFTVTHGPYQPAPVEGFCRRYPAECAARADRERFDFLADFYHRAHAFLSYDYEATAERAGMTEEHRRRLAEAVELLYRANVSRLDQLFGEVVDALQRRDLLDRAVVVFTADHGETLFREGTLLKWTHGHQLAPEVLGVPLLLRAPGVAPGSWEPVSRSIDVLPTVAGLAGIGFEPGRLDGVDLSPALRGVEPPPALVAYSHTSLIAEPVLEASQRWGLFHRLYPRIDPELIWARRLEGDIAVKLRREPEGELVPAVYDLAADPWELHDLYRPDDPEQRRDLADLRRYRDRLIAAYARHAGNDGLDFERQKEILQSLGYVD